MHIKFLFCDLILRNENCKITNHKNIKKVTAWKIADGSTHQLHLTKMRCFYRDVLNFKALSFLSVEVRLCHLLKISWEVCSCLCVFNFSLQTNFGSQSYYLKKNYTKISTLKNRFLLHELAISWSSFAIPSLKPRCSSCSATYILSIYFLFLFNFFLFSFLCYLQFFPSNPDVHLVQQLTSCPSISYFSLIFFLFSFLC